MLYLALAGLPFSFRTVNLKIGVQNTHEYLAINRWGVVPSLRHRGLTTISVRFLTVRTVYPRTSLRGKMRDGQMPTVPDRHEAKAEA